MDVTSKEISAYAEAHTTSESEVLRRLNRETNAKVMYPRMLSGHLQGRVLSMISWMLRPKFVLEIGTYTGYSALCLAEGLADGGRVLTLDVNEELEPFTRKFIAESGLADRIDYRIGNALDLIPTLETPFDLVFLDADKLNYPRYFDLVIDRLRPGGFFMADNVLWSGKVAQTPPPPDETTLVLNEFNQKIHADSRVENVLLPIRDGLLVARKKSWQQQ
ncbi:MAG: O-methyltransferase [Sphingobacteriaceae bacterium]|nr:O-methyltransferase [Cytophagaceae bacterium]